MANQTDSQLQLPFGNYAVELPIQLLLVGAIRQGLWIHRKSPPTYEEALHYTVDVAERIVPPSSELAKSYDSITARLYRQRARAQSKQNQKQVSPLTIVNNDIAVYQIELQAAEEDDHDGLKAEIERLKRAKQRLDTEKWTEAKSIDRDADVPELLHRILEKGQGYKLYEFKKNHKLAVRVLHPDKAEDITGVDLVYEMYRYTSDGIRVRIVGIQYKRWDRKALYTSKSKNLEQQLIDMEHSFCKSEICNTVLSKAAYRLPNCSAFLRLTDIEQTRDGWYLTDGQHIRVCDVKRLAHVTEKKHLILHAEVISDACLSQESFQELFNKSMIGSEWMPFSNLDQWYSRANVFDATDKIVAHVKDIAY